MELVRRDTRERINCKRDELMLRIPKILDEIQGNLLIQAKALLNGCISQANSLNALKSLIDSKGGFVMCGWCEDQECELRIKEATGADIRVIPFVGQDLASPGYWPP